MAFNPARQYSTYENVTTGANGTVPGGLPLKVLAGGMRYRKEFSVSVGLHLFGSKASMELTGGFAFNIRDAPAPDGRILFTQAVQLTMTVVAFKEPFFGGIGMATWYPSGVGDDDGAGIVTTTVVNGDVIQPADGWKYVDVLNPTANAEKLGYMILNSSATITTGDIQFYGTWYSPPYRLDLAPGAVMERVGQDTWSFGSVLKEATYAFSFREGTPHLDGITDPAGALRLARVAAGGLHLVHTYYGAEEFETRARLKGLTEPSIWKDATNRLWLAAVENSAYKLFFSCDDGYTVRRVQIPGADNKMADVTIFDSTFKLPRARGLQSGVTLAWALKGGKIWTKRSPDGLDWTTAPRPGPEYKSQEPYALIEDLRDGSLRLTNGHSHVVESRDGGVSWEDK